MYSDKDGGIAFGDIDADGYEQEQCESDTPKDAEEGVQWAWFGEGLG